MRYATVAAALAGAAFATPLTVIDPCPAAPTKFPAVTVTAQYQPVSFCVPTSTCHQSNCTTEYPMLSTSTYVSTVIPCAVNGTSASSCTVTTTDQVVPCSEYATTITSVTAVPTTYVHGNLTTSVTVYSTHYETISKEYSAPYNKIGAMGIPGYEGSDLCTECNEKSDGSREQLFNINECHASDGKAPVCSKYDYTWVSMPAPSTTAPATATCSSRAAVSEAGVYTYTFAQVAPETTLTSDKATVTVPAQPWYAYVTKSCSGPTTFDFTVTVTKTITYTVPYSHTPDASATNTWQEWGAWQITATTPAKVEATPTGPASSTAYPTDKPWDSSATSTPAQWANWGHSTSSSSSAVSPVSTSSSSATTSVSTSLTTSVTTSSAGPTGTQGPNFYLSVIANPGQRFRKRAPKYVGFSGDDATSVDRPGAAQFSYDGQGELTTGGEYVQRDGPVSGYIPFEKSGSPSGGRSKFTCTIGSPLILPGASFCLAGDSVIISFGSSPSGCVPCNLICDNGDGTSTSTTATSTSMSTTTSAVMTTTPSSSVGPITTLSTSTTSSYVSTTTSSAPDISADLDIPDPTPAPQIRKFRGMKY